jgi:anti-sigma B factor antagonist
LIADGKTKVVLNMANITFIDSAGLGTLVAAHHSAKSQGAALKLAHLGSKFQEVLQITKLLTVFDVYNTEAEAVASFAK